MDSDYTQSDISAQTIIEREFEEARFIRTMMVGTRFQNCKFYYCNFTGCDATSAEFTDCVFDNCNFATGNFVSCVFYGCDFRQRPALPDFPNDTELKSAQNFFTNSSFQGATFASSKSRLAQFSGCVFTYCSFRHSKFFKVSFKNTWFFAVGLNYATFDNCDIPILQLQRCATEGIRIFDCNISVFATLFSKIFTIIGVHRLLEVVDCRFLHEGIMFSGDDLQNIPFTTEIENYMHRFKTSSMLGEYINSRIILDTILKKRAIGQGSSTSQDSRLMEYCNDFGSASNHGQTTPLSAYLAIELVAQENEVALPVFHFIEQFLSSSFDWTRSEIDTYFILGIYRKMAAQCYTGNFLLHVVVTSTDEVDWSHAQKYSALIKFICENSDPSGNSFLAYTTLGSLDLLLKSRSITCSLCIAIVMLSLFGSANIKFRNIELSLSGGFGQFISDLIRNEERINELLEREGVDAEKIQNDASGVHARTKQEFGDLSFISSGQASIFFYEETIPPHIDYFSNQHFIKESKIKLLGT